MSVEPVAGQIVLAKTALQTGTAAIQLSDSVIGRLKLKREVARAEERDIRRWLEEQLAVRRLQSEVRLNAAAMAAITCIWEDRQAATARNPDAARYFDQLSHRTISKIMHETPGLL